MRKIVLKSKERREGFVLVFVLSILLLSAGALFFFIALMMRQTQVERTAMGWEFAMSAAESGAQEAITYLLTSKTSPELLKEDDIAAVLQKRWVTNDNRYEGWGFPTNAELKILSAPEPMDEGRSFYVAGFQSPGENEYEIYALGGLYPVKGTNPIVRLVRVKAVGETPSSTNVLQGELIAVRQLNFLGGVSVQGTNSAQVQTNGSSTNGAVVISAAYPNIDSFKGSNRIEGYYLAASAHLPEGLQLPVEETETNNEVEPPPENILLVGGKDFLKEAKAGYETNHLITRLNWAGFSSREAPLEANCKEVPLVNIGKEKETNLVYQFDASGDYKITGADLHPFVLKAGAVVNLRLPAGYVLSEVPVTMEEKAKLALFPVGDVTLGVKAFSTVEKKWERLSVWGGTNEAQKLTLQGQGDTLLCARVYAPHSEVMLTNTMNFCGLLCGGKVTLGAGTRFWGDLAAREAALDVVTNFSSTNFHLRVKEWEEVELYKSRTEEK